jgi:hypothetical protein
MPRYHVTRHAQERFSEHHPGADHRDVIADLDKAVDIDGQIVKTMLARRLDKNWNVQSTY